MASIGFLAFFIWPYTGSAQTFMIYKGVVDYGQEEVTKANADSLRFDFISPDGQSHHLKLSSLGGSYKLHDRLEEGALFELRLAQGTDSIIALERQWPVAQGHVTALSPATIEIDQQVYPLPDSVAFAAIEPRAGGAAIAMGAPIRIGDPAMVYSLPIPWVVKTYIAEPYTPPVAGTPGLRTIKNLLQTALMPVGTTLYVYGGGWNWMDTAGGETACILGLPEEWLRFFQSNDSTYQYKNPYPPQSFYPWSGFNEYNHHGADCTGYIGWALYNVMETSQDDNREGYVSSSTRMASDLAERYGWGEVATSRDPQDYLPGDIVSFTGHIWMVVGRCADNSIVLLHSTVDNDAPLGSGVQLSALSPTADPDCQALALARHYMTTYYPEWTCRYRVLLKDWDKYTLFEAPESGRFTWHIGAEGLSDPDGYRSLTAEEILLDLFKDAAKP